MRAARDVTPPPTTPLLDTLLATSLLYSHTKRAHAAGEQVVVVSRGGIYLFKLVLTPTAPSPRRHMPATANDIQARYPPALVQAACER